MRFGRKQLEAGILELFKLACADSRPMVAEHLLQALEAIDAAEATGAGVAGRSALAEAYQEVANERFRTEH